jgi:hypothetical protein
MTYAQEQAKWRRYSRQYVRKFWGGYVECALWASSDETDESGGGPMDQNYAPADIEAESFKAMQSECADFIFHNRRTLKASGLPPEIAGYCFWLNRNGHGSGFWDRDLGQVGDQLSEASEAAGECTLYVGDDGKVYAT